jgi:predicted Zn finger-like uncharacterized protein
MLIVCPSCAARYDVPARLARAAPMLRCAGCQHEFPVPPVAVDADNVHAAAADASTSGTPALPRPGDAGPIPDPDLSKAQGSAVQRGIPFLRGRPPVALGWVASFGVLYLAGQGAIAYRDGIMLAWPPSRRLFLWLGLG